MKLIRWVEDRLSGRKNKQRSASHRGSKRETREDALKQSDSWTLLPNDRAANKRQEPNVQPWNESSFEQLSHHGSNCFPAESTRRSFFSSSSRPSTTIATCTINSGASGTVRHPCRPQQSSDEELLAILFPSSPSLTDGEATGTPSLNRQRSRIKTNPWLRSPWLPPRHSYGSTTSTESSDSGCSSGLERSPNNICGGSAVDKEMMAPRDMTALDSSMNFRDSFNSSSGHSSTCDKDTPERDFAYGRISSATSKSSSLMYAVNSKPVTPLQKPFPLARRHRTDAEDNEEDEEGCTSSNDDIISTASSSSSSASFDCSHSTGTLSTDSDVVWSTRTLPSANSFVSSGAIASESSLWSSNASLFSASIPSHNAQQKETESQYHHRHEQEDALNANTSSCTTPMKTELVSNKSPAVAVAAASHHQQHSGNSSSISGKHVHRRWFLPQAASMRLRAPFPSRKGGQNEESWVSTATDLYVDDEYGDADEDGPLFHCSSVSSPFRRNGSNFNRSSTNSNSSSASNVPSPAPSALANKVSRMSVSTALYSRKEQGNKLCPRPSFSSSRVPLDELSTRLCHAEEEVNDVPSPAPRDWMLDQSCSSASTFLEKSPPDTSDHLMDSVFRKVSRLSTSCYTPAEAATSGLDMDSSLPASPSSPQTGPDSGLGLSDSTLTTSTLSSSCTTTPLTEVCPGSDSSPGRVLAGKDEDEDLDFLSKKLSRLRVELNDVVGVAIHEAREEEIRMREERLSFYRELMEYKRLLVFRRRLDDLKDQFNEDISGSK